MATKLADSLKLFGYRGDVQTFNELIADLFAEMHPNQTDEDLLVEPDQSMKYCDVVRRRSRCKDLPYRIILRSLTNLRKRSGLKDHETNHPADPQPE
jgi:hypothetical protein